jgi:hypothetical protein
MATGLRITNFGGIIPRLSDRGLPDTAAQFALNAKLYSGELRAWARLKALSALSISNAKTVFHYRHTGLDRYLAFPTFTNVVKAPLVNETAGRLYWTPEAGGARFNTTARIELAQVDFPLGLSPPLGTFTVVPSGGTAATAETRVYLAIWVGNYGEESAPGTPVTVSGNADGTWTVNGLNTLTIDPTYTANRAKLRLYRTITSISGADYRQVIEWNVGSIPASYVDNVSSTALSTSPVLQSLGWDVPPSDLKGLISVAGGFLAGFTGRTVRLSVPYQPHAWPVDYSFAVDDDIVGLGTFGNFVVVCTQGRGFVLVGSQPDAMSLQKMEGVQPCLSKRSIVSTSGAVMYASTDGVAAFDGSSLRAAIVSRMWVTKDEWMAQFSPATQMSSIYQDRYFAFYSATLGLTIGFDDPVTGFTELQQTGVSSVDLDTLTGQTLVTVGDTVYEWDGDTSGALTYTWRSKQFLQPKPVNWAALQIRASFIGSGSSVTPPPAQGIGGYALNELGINAGKKQPGPAIAFAGAINGPPAWLALGLAPAPPAAGPEIAVKLYVDGILRWFGTVDNEKVQRLPSGYKGVMTEIEVQGVSPIYSIVLADTAKGLENVQ